MVKKDQYKRKSSDDKSKVFTTIRINVPLLISICGTKKQREDWKHLFEDKSAGKTFRNWILKDMDCKDMTDLINSTKELKELNDKMKKELIEMVVAEKFFGEKKIANLQDYTWEHVEEDIKKRGRKGAK